MGDGGRLSREGLIAYFSWQQRLYEDGYSSVWGWWNRMAEYLLKGPRRIRHDC